MAAFTSTSPLVLTIVLTGAQSVYLCRRVTEVGCFRHSPASTSLAMVEMYLCFAREDGELKLLGPRGRVLEVLTLFRLLDTIPSFNDETQALASFRPLSCAASPQHL